MFFPLPVRQPIRTKFPSSKVAPFQWLRNVESTLAELLEIVESQPDMSDEMDISEIRSPTVTEIIEKQIAPTLETALRAFEEGKMKNTIPGRGGKSMPIIPEWLSSPIRTETEIWMELRIASPLETFKLAFDCDNHKFNKSLSTSNSITRPHEIERQRLAQQGTRIVEPAVIVSFTLHHPVRGFRSLEVECLGSNSFADLMKKLTCEEDNQMFAKQYRFAFILLSGLFISDNADVSVLDQANRIIEHLLTHVPNSLNPTDYRRSIQTTLVGSCLTNFQQSGCYLHCGDCNHRIVPITMRRYDSRFDCPYEESYPLVVYKPATKSYLCQCCLNRLADIYVVNCLDLPQNPMIMCNTCCNEFKPGGTNVFTVPVEVGI